MTEFEFRDLVFKLRRAQRRYFLNRQRSDLEEAKRLEGLVDKELLGDRRLFPRAGTDASE